MTDTNYSARKCECGREYHSRPAMMEHSLTCRMADALRELHEVHVAREGEESMQVLELLEEYVRLKP